ncbi:MAG: hypothetical protein Fur0010_20870 [Bdellovibrio sp.]
MNITPNSFSDGNQLQSPSAITEKIETFKKYSVDVVDLGFESTAPMNQPITLNQELERMHSFFQHAPESLMQFAALSVDTYRFETALEFSRLLKVRSFRGKIIWNDVSGIKDGLALEWLHQDSNHHYVYCHNLSPLRESGANHMAYVQSSDINYKSYFEQATQYFMDFTQDRVWFDPTPGFSKSYEQNLLLISQFKHLIDSLGPHRPWVVALSRKRFLRQLVEELTGNVDKDYLFNKSEFFHLLYIQMLRTSHNPLYFRVHDPFLMTVSEKFLHLLQNGPISK